MSIRAIQWAFEQTVNSPIAKLVLIKLADNANDDGLCWPSKEYIARHCGIDKSNLKRYIRQLEELGLLEVEHRVVNNVSIGNIYHLKTDVATQVGSQRPDGGVTATPGVGSPRPPNRHLEPSLNLKSYGPPQNAKPPDSPKRAPPNGGAKGYSLGEGERDRVKAIFSDYLKRFERSGRPP